MKSCLGEEEQLIARQTLASLDTGQKLVNWGFKHGPRSFWQLAPVELILVYLDKLNRSKALPNSSKVVNVGAYPTVTKSV